MQVTAPKLPVPFTNNRAMTELVQSRKQVDAARRSLELAFEIFSKMDGGSPAIPLIAIERVLGQLEEAEASLWEAAQ